MLNRISHRLTSKIDNLIQAVDDKLRSISDYFHNKQQRNKPGKRVQQKRRTTATTNDDKRQDPAHDNKTVRSTQLIVYCT